MKRKLYRADLAAMAGIETDSLNRLKLPPRDGTDVEGGHARPYWWAETAKEWLANRPGRGWRRGVRSA